MAPGKKALVTIAAAALAAAAAFPRFTGKAARSANDEGPSESAKVALPSLGPVPAVGEGSGKSWTLREAVALGRSRDAAAIPELRRLALASPDPLVAGNAVQALGRLGAVAKDRELLALIDDPRPRVRQEAVVALGRSGDRSVVDRIARLLDDEDATLRRLALQALGRLGGDRARERVESVLRAPGTSEVDRAFARAALRKG